MSPEERIQAVTDALWSVSSNSATYSDLAKAAIAAADATRPKLSAEQLSRLKLDVFRMIRDFEEDTPGHTSPLERAS